MCVRVCGSETLVQSNLLSATTLAEAGCGDAHLSAGVCLLYCETKTGVVWRVGLCAKQF